MPILNKKERERIEDKWSRGQELTPEETSDLAETLDFEEEKDKPHYMEVIDDDNNVTWQPITPVVDKDGEVTWHPIDN